MIIAPGPLRCRFGFSNGYSGDAPEEALNARGRPKMTKDFKHKPFARHRLSGAEDGAKGVSVGPPTGRTPPQKLLASASLADAPPRGGGLAFLWPVFETVGTGVAVAMIAAVLVVSLTPLLLLRTIVSSPPT